LIDKFNISNNSQMAEHGEIRDFHSCIQGEDRAGAQEVGRRDISRGSAKTSCPHPGPYFNLRILRFSIFTSSHFDILDTNSRQIMRSKM
jgi:hypothetical protein